MKITLLTFLGMIPFSNPAVPNPPNLPNPAVVNCADNGGIHEILESDAGQLGACRVEGGLIGSWTLYREMNGTKSTAVEKFFNKEAFTWPGYGNPAAHYCSQVGGSIKTYESEAGQTGFCEFEDGSTINQWTLFGGSEENEKLADLFVD